MHFAQAIFHFHKASSKHDFCLPFQRIRHQIATNRGKKLAMLCTHSGSDAKTAILLDSGLMNDGRSVGVVFLAGAINFNRVSRTS
jgi:hypothetical protein